MRVSAALQILTTVMSGTTGNAAADMNDWSAVQHVQQQDFSTPRADLDLGACLDVETLDDFTNNMYNNDATADATAAESAWVDNVIDMTSSGELTSSDDHTAGVVPSHLELLPEGGFPLAGTLPAAAGTEGFDFGDSLSDTDNAVFNTLQFLTSATLDAGLVDNSSPVIQDRAQFGSVNSASLTNTITTIDLSALALEQFITLDGDTAAFKNEASEDFTIATSSSSNIPSSLWNLDLKLSSAVYKESQPSTSASGVTPQDVKETLKSRLYSRHSGSSVSMDSDVNASCSSSTATRTMSSPTSSLTQSFEEEDPEDPQTALEKREKNRVAAQKCRCKKREKEENLEKSVNRLEERKERLKEEVQKLRDQRETLEEIINVHGMVCPKIRKISKS